MTAVKRSPNATRSVSARTRNIVWARGGGRCYICNESLIGDLLTGAEDRNFGFVAHIIAESEGGPRGDPVRSPALADDPSNLVLLCHVHHKLIDVDAVLDFPEKRLQEIKRVHEHRVSVVTSIGMDRASHVLRYGASIGQHQSLISYSDVASAMLPDRYPAEGKQTIDIELRGSAFVDRETGYWELERENLRRQYRQKVACRLESREIRHLSVFALAPQPLLIELGRLLGDITPASVHQRHREPCGWRWADDGDELLFEVIRPSRGGDVVALVLGISASIDVARITNVMGDAAAVWIIRAVEPHNDILRRAKDLAKFRMMLRKVFNEIKWRHPAASAIHVFPAAPVAAAVEVGRTWMPKADLPMTVYDENRMVGGFYKALQIE